MDIPLLLSTINAARELGSALIQERDRLKAAAIQVDLSEKLIQAQTQISEVLAAITSKDASIAALLERVRELENRQNEHARYLLAKVGILGDFFAYGLRPAAELSERADEPAHFICQPCFDAGKKSVLRIAGATASCSLCNTHVQIGAVQSGIRTISRGIRVDR